MAGLHIRALLEAQATLGAAAGKLMLYSQAGFTTEVRTAAKGASDIVLVNAGDLYSPSDAGDH